MNRRNWVETTLNEIAEINPSLDKSDLSDDLLVSFVPMPSVQAKTGKINLTETRKLSEVKKGFTSFQKNDVLFAKITPCMENGKMAIVPSLVHNVGFGSTEFHVLRPRSGINPAFIYYFVSSDKFRSDAEHNMTGAVGQRRVPTQYLKNHPISIPPLNEQCRIVAKIEELFAEIDKGIERLLKAQELLKVYRQSLLKSAATGDLLVSSTILENPLDESYKISLSKIILQCGQGWSPKCENKSSLDENSWVVIKTTAIQSMNFFENENKVLPSHLNPKAHLEIQPGDILITRAGPRNRVGVACLVKKCRRRLILCDKAYRIRVDSSSILPEYLEMLLNTPQILDSLEELKTGINDSGVNLTQDRFLALELLIPPLDLQQQILQKVNGMLSVINELQIQTTIALANLDSLRGSILKNAFSGMLVPPNHNDEPGDVLLERIKAEQKFILHPRKKPKQPQKVTV